MFNKTILLLSLCMMSNMAFSGIPTDAQSIVDNLMKVYYGSQYNEGEKCYMDYFTAKEKYDLKEYAICVKIIKSEIKYINNIPTLFLTTSGDLMDNGPRAFSSLGGLFILQKKEKDWHIIAKNPYIDSGDAGRSQMSNYRLVKIGTNQYAWLGEECTSGAGGETSCQTNIYAPIAKNIPLIAEITSHHSYEFLSSGEYIDENAKITILKNQPVVNGYYPISVKVKTETGKFNRQGQKVKPQIKHHQYKMVFDVKMQKFIEVKEKQ